MSRHRGYTLIELMIVVAIVGITAAAAGVTGSRIQMDAFEVLQQEEALLLLEYHASCLSSGRPADPAVADRLLAPLPDAALSRASAAGATTLTVRWRDPYGRPVSRGLTVFERGAGR